MGVGADNAPKTYLDCRGIVRNPWTYFAVGCFAVAGILIAYGSVRHNSTKEGQGIEHFDHSSSLDNLLLEDWEEAPDRFHGKAAEPKKTHLKT